MDQQGTGWTRPAADTRGQGPRHPWQRDDTGPRDADPRQADLQDSARTAPQPRLGAGDSGARPAYGSGAQPTHGSGAQRMPERGYPPAHGPGREPGRTGSGAWSTSRPPVTDTDHEYSPDSGYGPLQAATAPNVPNPGAPAPNDPGTGPLDTGALDTGTLNLGDPPPTGPQPVRAGPISPGGRRSAKARPKRGRLASRPRLLAAIVVVVVAAAGFGGYKLFYEPRLNAPVSPSLRLPTNAAPSSANQSLGTWQHIGTRTQDPDPLTVAGLFPPQFELSGSSYLQTAATVTSNCAQAVYGTKLQSALKSGHCTQVARATYLSGNSGNGQMMGTVGVVNLDSVADASKVGQASGPQDIIAPLSAKTGPTKKLGNGTGFVQAEVKGHYLIMIWAEFADLKSPSTTAAKTSLEQFATTLVTGSANINLSTRMLSGKA